MTPKFVIALELILKLEGGEAITNDPHDPGGVTKYGISAKAFPELGEEGVKKLTLEQAKGIYKAFYWDKINGDKLPVDIAICVFDGAVNQGVIASAKLLQEAVKVKMDGKIGPITLGAVQAFDSDWLLREFLTLRQLRYLKTEGFSRYGKGWNNRLFHVCQGATIAKDYLRRI